MGVRHLTAADSSRGRLITLEGGEGAGKTTLSRGLAAFLAGCGLPVLRTREPGGSPGAEAVRRLVLGRGGWDPLAEALLMSAARREHIARTVLPAMAAGIWVVSDRFADSTAAYQGAAEGVSPEQCRSLAELALGDLRPSLTLVLDVPAGTGTRRALARGDANRFEGESAAFHARVRQAFLDIAAAEPERCVVLDGSAPVAAVLEAAQRAVGQRLGLSAP
ncbi:dTMP kinase [Roseomonas sp. BN140053]|uniref:dTMP kinase n=1 Tax=Roseomonas sp. BN140053 TaxID=3391898 RepID=UPI0039E7C654